MCRILLYLDWKKENTEQKKLRIWILFTQCSESMSIESQGLTHFKYKKKGLENKDLKILENENKMCVQSFES